jgi:hypothetical protein
MAKDDLERAFEALAAAEGRSVEDLKLDLIRDRLQTHTGGSRPRASAPRRETQLARRSDDPYFPGSPVVRRREEAIQRPEYDDDDGDETPAEAQERWYREEQELPDGVHGWGGQSAGGIFGDGAIATEEYDPMAEQRTERRAATQATAQQAVAVTQLTEAVGLLLERVGGPRLSGNMLSGMGRRQLGRGRRR